jgi:hypothetical protein
MAMLGLSQRALAERAFVSQAVVREIQHHTVERRRSPRTLEALSVALGWPPHYLSAVVRGRPPLAGPEVAAADRRGPTVLSIIQKLDEIASQVDSLTTMTTEIMRRLPDLAAMRAETDRRAARCRSPGMGDVTGDPG